MSQRMFGLLVVFVFVLVLTGSAQAQLQTPDDGSDLTTPVSTLPISEEIDFGTKVAGSWLGSGWFDIDVFCDGSLVVPWADVTDAHTFDVGGSHVATNPMNPNSGHGTWVKTGPRQITVRDINFGVDSTPLGTLLNKSIVTMVVDFDRSFKTATTTFGAKVYDPADDPLDPAAVPTVCTVGAHDSFKKVSATE